MAGRLGTRPVGAEARRFALFLLTGGIAALVNILSRAVLSKFMVYEAAVAIAFPLGLTTAYLLARLFVFAPSGRSAVSEYSRFALVNVAAFVQVWGVSVLLARLVFPLIGFAWHAETVAHVIGVLSPVATSYYAHKKYSFAKSESAP